MAERSAVLETTALTVRYGGVCAVDGISLSVGRGEIVGLIGPNGAGKTSLLDGITGFAPATGEVMVEGTDVSGWKPHRRSGAGLARTWQQGDLFEDLTVEGNLLVARHGLRLLSAFTDLLGRPPAARKQVLSVLERLGIGGLAHRRPSEISVGQQKLVGVGRAIVNQPHVLLLDEPAAGLDTDESAALGEVIVSLAREGHAVLLIEHDMHLVREICSRLYVMDYGKLLASGATDDVINDPAVVAAYLGRPAQEEEAHVNASS